MPSVRLIAENVALLEALASAEAFRRRHDAAVSAADLVRARDLTTMSLDFMARARALPPWLCYLTICTETGTLVGCCGFRGNPRDVGGGLVAPEIAYHTFPDFEGRGYATAMALQLFDLAREADAAATASAGKPTAVIAHTLREGNTSTRVLARAGFRFVGEVDDPEDGLVWRWQRELAETSAQA
jgi:RimJ/RimL family protein N-acetyltransferase